MRILVVNPNTTESMTRSIRVGARAAAGPGTQVDAVQPLHGPAAIEGPLDEARCLPGLLDVIATRPADGYVLACFGDPGLDAARVLADAPVVGIAEAALRTAGYLGRGFGVVTTVAAELAHIRDLTARYGVAGSCRSVRACDLPVLDVQRDPEAVKRILAEARAAVELDGAEVIVLGCAAMTELRDELAAELGVPVIDGVAAAVATVEGLARLGLRTSRAGAYGRG